MMETLMERDHEMTFENVQPLDRCWAAKGGVIDARGQNGVVTSINTEEGTVNILLDGTAGPEITRTPGEDVFWCKPRVPTGPERLVEKKGWVNLYKADDTKTYPSGIKVGLIHTTAESAKKAIGAADKERYVDTINITWCQKEIVT